MSNRDLPMMPWYPDQFAASCRAWRYAWRCAYRELLDVQWQIGTLPDDVELLASAIGCPLGEFREVWPHIAGKFQKVDGGLRNFRLEEHRLAAMARKDKMRKGAASTNAKRAPSATPSATLSGTPSGTGSDTPGGSHPSLSPSPYKNSERAPQGAEAPRAQTGGRRLNGGNHPPPTQQRNDPAWEKLTARATASGFRPPFDVDTLETYETSLKIHERDHPVRP